MVAVSPHGSFSRRIAKVGCPVLVFLASLALYVSTMPPSIAVVGYAADTLKFQYIGKIFGTPHFGYPTYMFLNILFCRLPFFNLAYRLNLLSALLASGTLVMVYFIILFLVRSRAIASICALLFGVAYTFWENAIIAEVYTLNTLFMSAVVLLMLKWGESRQSRFFYFGCLVYAVSFGNHLIQITLLPALIFWTFAVDPRILLKKKTYLFVSLAILLGMSQYGYVLLRSYQNPPPEKVFQMWPYSEDSGRTHMEVYARSIPEVFDKATGGHWGRSHQGETKWKVRPGEDLTEESTRRGFSFLRDLLFLHFSPVGVFLGVTGIALAFVRERKRSLFLLLIIFGHLAFVMTWGIPVDEVQILPSCLVLTLFIAHNDRVQFLPPFSRRPYLCRAGRAVLLVLLAGLTGFLAVSRYPKIDQSRNVWLSEKTESILTQIPDDTLIFTDHVLATAFWYKLYGEEVRPGARITVHPIWKVYHEDIEYALAHYRHVFYYLGASPRPTLEHMGFEAEIYTISQYDWREYFSMREPGDIVVMYGEVDGPSSAVNVANAFKTPPPLPGVYAIVGRIEAGGTVRILAWKAGPLSLARGTAFGTTRMPVDISIVPGESIYIDDLNCSRYKKRNNLAVIDAESGRVVSTTYVDWKYSSAIEPAHLLRVTKAIRQDSPPE